MVEFRLPAFGHGGDYNPDQWLDRPDILEQDIEYMKEAGITLVSVGIFAWAALEPEEGKYNFGWLKDILDKLHAAGVSVLLATPSGARPAWMSLKYPEVLRVRNGVRNNHGNRHNHCLTSPVYRSFVTKMNTRLAETFGTHPAVVGWHISNEYGGDCQCELCQEAFRGWLKNRYQTLDNINHAWWTAFWAKTYTDWNQIRSPESIGETAICGMILDWRRFVSDQTRDFFRNEIAPIRKLTPNLPVSINTMTLFEGLDYSSFKDDVDFFGFDAYPMWGGKSDYDVAIETALTYDQVRGYGNRVWSLMECTPSQVNWQDICRMKRTGLHPLVSLQAVAHGSDTVMMFQWRKGRGAFEKFHGAVVGHDATNKTRVFKEVKQVGAMLKDIKSVVNAEVKSEVAVIFDQQARWALDGAQGPRKNKDYCGVVKEHYEALYKMGLNVDVIDCDKPLDGYRIVVAPYLYMVREGIKEKLEAYVKNGGTLVVGFFSGLVDESDLCFLGGAPGPIRALCGVWAEETDALYDGQTNTVRMEKGNPLGMEGEYACSWMCDILNLEGASAVASYASDYYEGTPAVTVNRFGSGKTYYIATRMEQKFYDEFYKALVKDAGAAPVIDELPDGVLATRRVKGDQEYVFVMNFSREERQVNVPEGIDLLTGKETGGRITLYDNGASVIEVRK